MTSPPSPAPSERRGSRVLVHGAAGAIGAAVCARFARAGAAVVAADQNAPHEVVAELAGEGHRALACDVTDPGAVAQTTAEAFTDAVDAVVYAAGQNTTGHLAELDWADYDRVMDVNLRGAFHAAQAAVRGFLTAATGSEGPSGRRSPGGAIVLLSSVAGKRGEAGASVYSASKFGVLGLTQSLAAEVAPSGIRVNAVCPGNVDTPMLDRLAADVAAREGREPAAARRDFAAEAAAGRLVTPSEVAEACVWLADPSSSALTGAAIDVDAGVLVGS